MGKYIDITNQIFGRLTAIKRINESEQSIWLFSCSCGNTISMPADRVKSGNTNSCGCLRRELLINKNKTAKHFKYSLEIKNKCVELYLSGLNCPQIAKQLNITKSIVYSYVRRSTTLRAKGRQYYYNERFFENINSEEKAYWMGFIAADGNINKELNRLFMQLKVGDKNHLQKFLRAIGGEDYSIRHRITELKNKLYETCYIEVNGKKLAFDLNKHGIVPKKSLILKPWNGPNDLQIHYWRGLIDGDGCISFYKNGQGVVTLVSGSKDLIQGFVNFIKRNSGLEGRISPHGTIYSVSFSCKKAIIVAKLLYGSAAVYLDRKFQRAKRLIALS